MQTQEPHGQPEPKPSGKCKWASRPKVDWLGVKPKRLPRPEVTESTSSQEQRELRKTRNPRELSYTKGNRREVKDFRCQVQDVRKEDKSGRKEDGGGRKEDERGRKENKDAEKRMRMTEKRMRTAKSRHTEGETMRPTRDDTNRLKTPG